MRPNTDSQYNGGPVNWRIITSLIPYLTEFRGRVALAMGFLILAKLAGVAVPWSLKLIVDHFENPADALVLVPVALLVGYGLLRFGSVFFSELRDAVFARVAERAMRRVSLRVFEHPRDRSDFSDFADQLQSYVCANRTRLSVALRRFFNLVYRVAQ